WPRPKYLFTVVRVCTPPTHSLVAFHTNSAASGAFSSASRAPRMAVTLTPLSIFGVASAVVWTSLIVWSPSCYRCSPCFFFGSGRPGDFASGDVKRSPHSLTRTVSGITGMAERPGAIGPAYGHAASARRLDVDPVLLGGR